MRNSSILTLAGTEYRFAVESKLLSQAERNGSHIDDWVVRIVDDISGNSIFEMRLSTPISDRDTDGQPLDLTVDYVFKSIAEGLQWIRKTSLYAFEFGFPDFVMDCLRAEKKLATYGITTEQLIEHYVDDETRAA